MQAPPNEWQELSRMNTARDIVALVGEGALVDPEPFTGVVDATAARAGRGGAGAARGDGGGVWGDEELEGLKGDGFDDEDTEWMPEP